MGSPTAGGVLMEVRNVRAKGEPGAQKDACIITADELGRIKMQLAGGPPREAIEVSENAEKMMMAASKIRREKMQKTDQENRAKFVPGPTRDQMLRAEGLLPQSQMQLDEELDEVKDMNSRMMFGRVVSVRDKQIMENNRMEKEFVDE